MKEIKTEDVKLFNGDCLEIMRGIEDESVDVIICDMPYGTTQCKWDSVIPLDELWKHYNRIIKKTGAIVLFADEPFTSQLILSNVNNFKYRFTWDKVVPSNFLNSKKMPLKQTEDICVFSNSKLGKMKYNVIKRDKEERNIRDREGENRKSQGSSTYNQHNGQLSSDYDKKKSYPTNLIQFNSKSKECNPVHRVHPTQKPVSMMEYLIEVFTDGCDVVLDSCMGSGSTGVAAVNTKRKFIGIEQDEKYFEIAKERIHKAIEESSK